MKKIFSLISLASVLLLLSCSNDENNIQVAKKTGDLIAKITFGSSESFTTRAGKSTAIPVTNWNNVKTMQLFLYYPENAPTNGGQVAFSAIIDPSSVANDPVKTFSWTNVPEGTYDLAVVANIDSQNSDCNIATSLNGGQDWTRFTQHNVREKKINSELFIDLKKEPLPAGHSFLGSRIGYLPASEVFVAYSTGVTITEGVTTELTGGSALKLKREVSLMRLRIDRTNKPSAEHLNLVDFNNDGNFVAVQVLPVGLGLKLGSFEGGIYSTPSDENRILIGGSGKASYHSADPTSGYNPTKILDGDFTLWKDIRVLPNATKAEGKAINEDSEAARRYTVIISGRVPQGYEYAKGSIAQADNTPVYWSGTVKGVFSPNIIREVNLVITSPGSPEPPSPEKEGGLSIDVGIPEEWDSNIQTETIEI